MSWFIFGIEADATSYGDAGPYPIAGTDVSNDGRFASAENKQTVRWAIPIKHNTLSEWAVAKQPAANSVADPAVFLREDATLGAGFIPTPEP